MINEKIGVSILIKPKFFLMGIQIIGFQKNRF